MVISRDEAVAALRDAETAEQRAQQARTYWRGSPHLILWGVIWAVGYTATGLLPLRLIGWSWLILNVLGFVISTLLERSQPRVAGTGAARPWGVAFFAIAVFMAATYSVLPMRTLAQYCIFPALMVSLVYALAGAWGRPRYFWIGAGVFCLSMLGFVFLKPILPFWLAGVGGGGLILGGLWLRKP